MKIEHIRTHGFDGSPKGTKWWVVAHNGKQYVVKRQTNSSGHKSQYEFIINDKHCNDVNKSVLVKLTPSTALVSMSGEVDFIDVTLGVQLAMFVDSTEQE